MSLKGDEALILAQDYVDKSLEGAGSLKGENGKSAYQVAVDNGFEGTEQEWLDSLVADCDSYSKDEIDTKINELNSNLNNFVNLRLNTSNGYSTMAEDIASQWGNVPQKSGLILVSNGATLLHGTYYKYSDSIGSIHMQDCTNNNAYVWSINNGVYSLDTVVLSSNLKNYNRPTNFIGYSNDVPTETWVKTSCDIVVDTTGDYMVNFPFLRNQGGNDISFNNYIVITDEDTLPNDYEAQMGSVTRNWGISSCSRCFRFNANTPYHIFVKHTASVAHTIDFYGYIFKLSEI